MKTDNFKILLFKIRMIYEMTINEIFSLVRMSPLLFKMERHTILLLILLVKFTLKCKSFV